MSMETERYEKRLEWLDEQRRKDAETISRLDERLGAFQKALEGHKQQMKSIASELARVGALAPRLEAFDDALDKHRKDVSRQFDEGQKRLISRQKDLESMWKADQKQSAMSLDEIRKHLTALEEVQEGLATGQDEDRRLRSALDKVRADVEHLQEHDVQSKRVLAAMDELQAQDAKKAVEIQGGIADLTSRSDKQRGMLDTAIDRIRRLESQGDELASASDEMREAQRLWREQLASRLAEFEREWKEWAKSFADFEQRADELDERIVAYEETFRALLQLKADLKEVIERLERRINEVGELQRLAEDRLKQEWSAFKADDHKRWGGFQLASEERWKDHGRLHERLETRTESVETGLEHALQRIGDLADGSRGRVLEALAMIRDWASEVDRKLSETK